MAATTKVQSVEQAVARIAYLASDVIVSVQPALAAETGFSKHLKAYAAARQPSLVARARSGDDAVPEIQAVRHNTDPLLSVFAPARAGRLVSVATSSLVLLPAVAHLYRLAHYPVVLHVALHPSPSGLPDYSSVTAVRNAGWTFLHSHSVREAQDLALTAHALAIRSGRGVIHFFDPASASASSPDDDAAAVDDVEELSLSVVRDVLHVEDAHRLQASSASASAAGIYADDGHVALVRDHVGLGSTDAVSVASSDLQSPVDDASDGKPEASTPSTRTSRQHSISSAPPPSVSSATTVDPSAPAPPVTSDDIDKYVAAIWAQLHRLVGRQYRAFEWSGPRDAENALFLFGPDPQLFAAALRDDPAAARTTGLLTVRLYRPWLAARLLEAIPPSVRRVAVLELVSRKTTKWGPLLVDVLTSVKGGGAAAHPHGLPTTVVGYQVGRLSARTVPQALRGVLQNLASDPPLQNLEIGEREEKKEQKKEKKTEEEGEEAEDPYRLEKPKLETAYDKILDQLFGSRLYVANALGSAHAGISDTVAASPEFGFGSLLARRERRRAFVAELRTAAVSGAFLTPGPRKAIARWLADHDAGRPLDAAADELESQLTVDNSTAARRLLASRPFFRAQSLWLVGSDAWAYDLGHSGVHHLLASGEDVNLLLIDSTPYSERAAADAARRKKDVGLYAMNFGNAYVASTAVYSSYTQVLQALDEADRFRGPSVVLAYLPYFGEHDSPLTVLQETKKAVDLGYWPLYRWNPDHGNAGAPSFALDSERIKKELREFLDRDNQLTQLMRREPRLAAGLAQDYGTEIRAQQRRRAKDAYDRLLEGLFGAPLTVLFASDNGNAEGLARRLARRGRARGLKTAVLAMEDYPVEDLPGEENVVFVCSTAGQGEFPQNGRAFWDAVKDSTDLDLASVRYAVMALGDSHYWPRKEDRIYYNKPGRDLDRLLAERGARRLAPLGLGDDQDPDGFQTGYQAWEPQLWEGLGVAGQVADDNEPPPVTNEDIKLASNYLRGTIAQGLLDTSTGAIAPADQQLTKFHGTYIQDDRDVRDERKAQGLEPAYAFMIRCRLPGGVATARQWLQMDDISTRLGNQTMKLTTRQTFQFHGVVKGNLRPAMQAINRALLTTLAACGDVNRNVMCSPLPAHAALHDEVQACAQRISDHLLPRTSAYHEIWLTSDEEFAEKAAGQKTLVAGNAVQDMEPLYGPTYLPRKFKITIAVPPHNDTDVYAHDIGLIAIRSGDGDGDGGRLEGFNLLAGGGMGVTHNNKKTYPQTGRMLGFVAKDEVHVACEKILLVQRDHGDRKNRKHARLKYTIDDMGLDAFRAQVEALWGRRFGAPRPFKFDSNVDVFGWVRDERGMNHCTLFVENGRVEDTAAFRMKTGLRELAKVHRGEFRLTPNQHLVVSNVADAEVPRVKALLAEYGLDNLRFSGLRLSSSACVAFPTCGLAMAESERYLPVLISKLEACLEEVGLARESIVMRMTGCPNGCARPWLAEVAFVGKAYGAYNMYLGGGYHGQRLNKLYRSSVKEDEILALMRPLLRRYAAEREEGEHFGDWTIRAGIIAKTHEGRDFHDNVAEEESDEE